MDRIYPYEDAPGFDLSTDEASLQAAMSWR